MTMDSSEFWIRSNDWKQYELYVKGALRRHFPNALVRANVYLPGKLSHARRQIDVLVEAVPPIAADCKCYKRKVTVNHVEAFLGMLEDIGFIRGIIVSMQGFSKAALRRAQSASGWVDLQIVSPLRLSDYQSIGSPLIWRGRLGIFLDCPTGWVVDNSKTHDPGCYLVAMYPIGHTLESAAKLASFLYSNIISKEGAPPSLDVSADRHEADLLKDSPNAKFEREHIKIIDEHGHSRAALLRTAQISAVDFGMEHALYVDYGEWVLLLVGLSAPGEANEMKDRLLSVARKSFTLSVTNRRRMAKQPSLKRN